MAKSTHSDDSQLTSWLEASSLGRALVVEDGRQGDVSPLARWLESVRATGDWQVIAISARPGLVLLRDVLEALFLALYPDDPEEAAGYSLIELREHVRGGLRGGDGAPPRIIALDRANWAERAFHEDLGYLLGRLHHEQKVVLSLRAEGGREPDLRGWCECLGWPVEETLCLHAPAFAGEERFPMERARQWLEVCLAVGNAGRPADVLDVLAAARRPLLLDEAAAILDVAPEVADAWLRAAPPGVVARNDARVAFVEPSVACAWAELRAEASVNVRKRLLALGDSILRGAAPWCVPYVVTHHGALLGERAGLGEQVRLVSEAWARAWSSAGGPLGFEADVGRVWIAAEREIAALASAPAEERAKPILALLRCVQVSRSVMSRVPCLPDTSTGLRREPRTGHTARERAAALSALAVELPEPERTRTREHAVDALLSGPVTTAEADLLVRLGSCVDDPRRHMLVDAALAAYRADAEGWSNGIGLLRVAALLPPAERCSLADEVARRMERLPEYDAASLVNILDAAPPDVASRLTPAIPGLPQPDRARLECALARHLEGDSLRGTVEDVLLVAQSSPEALGVGDIRSIAPALDAAQLSRMARALRSGTYCDEAVGICLRALCALGHAGEAESIAGPDPAAMPFDWVLALGVNLGRARADLRNELARQLAEMDGTNLGFTIERHAAELAGVLGIGALIRAARTITAGEERIVARVALVPYAEAPDKRALVVEAVAAFRDPTGQEGNYWQDLLACWEWMSPEDACDLLVYGCRSMEALWAIESLIPLLRHLAGPDAPLRLAEQVIEIGRWMA